MNQGTGLTGSGLSRYSCTEKVAQDEQGGSGDEFAGAVSNGDGSHDVTDLGGLQRK
jgi:hypothetical protein